MSLYAGKCHANQELFHLDDKNQKRPNKNKTMKKNNAKPEAQKIKNKNQQMPFAQKYTNMIAQARKEICQNAMDSA